MGALPAGRRLARGAGGLRITKYEIIPTRVPMHERVREAWQKSFFLQNRFQKHFTPTIVRLFAGDIVGIGDAMMPAGRARGILESMVGKNPVDYLLDDGLGGVLVAVYDLVGKAQEMPVSRLLAANPRPRIQQTWWSQCFPPELMAAEAKLGAELGYRVHKVKARPWEDPIEQAAAICDAIPRDMRVWVDANAWWSSVGRTLHFCERLEKFHNYFAIESPIRRERIDGYRELKGKVSLMVSEHMPRDPMPFVREGLLDAFVVGGPLGKTLVQRALMAEVTRVPLWVEHSIDSGVNQVFQAHQAAAFPGIEYTISITHVLEDDLMLEPFTMKGGFYEVPTKPGLGVSLDMDAIERYRVG
jgi:L-alanine-DL-glutamate epimerase-like enolase superfamily enzyme